jgi:hypothetical protein
LIFRPTKNYGVCNFSDTDKGEIKLKNKGNRAHDSQQVIAESCVVRYGKMIYAESKLTVMWLFCVAVKEREARRAFATITAAQSKKAMQLKNYNFRAMMNL